jgi:hypothetical protein
MAEVSEKAQLMIGAGVIEVGAEDLEGVERDGKRVASHGVLALSLGKPYCGKAPISKLVDDGVAVVAGRVGDGVANVDGMIAPGPVMLRTLEMLVVPHQSRLSVQRDARPRRRLGRFRHGGAWDLIW